MAYRNRNFDRNNYGGSISRNVDPWDTSNDWGMRGGGNGNMGGGGGKWRCLRTTYVPQIQH